MSYEIMRDLICIVNYRKSLAFQRRKFIAASVIA